MLGSMELRKAPFGSHSGNETRLVDCRGNHLAFITLADLTTMKILESSVGRLMVNMMLNTRTNFLHGS